jgi:hypothetical protein
MAEPNYGRNADLAAERDAILALPPDQMQRALLAFSQRRSGVPEIPGGYRNAEFAADLPAPTGRFAANIVPETRTAAAKTADVSDGSGAGTETGGSGASTTTPATLSPALQSIFGGMRGRIEKDIGLTRRQGEIQQEQALARATGTRDAQRSMAAAERAAAEQFRSRPIPAFVPTQENAADMGTLFSLLAVAGQTLGGKGKTGAMAAMAGMTGMLNGWRQGRQDLYQKERQNFEAGLRQIQAQNQALQQMYDRAVRAAQTDMQGALAEAERRAIELGAELPALAARRSGIQGFNTVDQAQMQVVSQLESRVQAQYAAEQLRLRTLGDQQQRDQALRTARNEDQQAQERRARAEADRVRGITTEAEAARNERERLEATARDRRNVQGQENYLEQQGLPREAISRIGEREVAAVSTRIEAAELTYRLAEAVKNNPQAAGLAGQIINRFERLDPSRYGNDVQGGFFNSLLNSFVDREPIRGTPDQIAQARSIAKLAVDVINARALAASGGSRMLVSEFNAQKGVISLEGQSPQSAVSVYNNLANDDIRGISRFGLSQYVPGLQTRAQEHAREYVARVFPSATGDNTTQPRPPSGNVQGAQGEAARARANDPSDGATATNPQTGERMIRRNGRWEAAE